MQIKQHTLIQELDHVITQALTNAKQMRDYPLQLLNRKPAPGKWSVLECLEHLNRYGDFYLPEIERQLSTAKNLPPGAIFTTGWIGNYFVKLIQVKDGQIKKMKTAKAMNPAGSQLSATTIDRFIKQLQAMQQLLLLSGNADLTHTKTAITLTQMIRLRLGDTLRFVVYHIERHMQQAQHTIDEINAAYKVAPTAGLTSMVLMQAYEMKLSNF